MLGDITLAQTSRTVHWSIWEASETTQVQWGKLEVLRTSHRQLWCATEIPGAAASGSSLTQWCWWNLRKCGPYVEHPDKYSFMSKNVPVLLSWWHPWKACGNRNIKLYLTWGDCVLIKRQRKIRELHSTQSVDCFYCFAQINSTKPQ